MTQSEAAEGGRRLTFSFSIPQPQKGAGAVCREATARLRFLDGLALWLAHGFSVEVDTMGTVN